MYVCVYLCVFTLTINCIISYILISLFYFFSPLYVPVVLYRIIGPAAFLRLDSMRWTGGRNSYNSEYK